MIINGLEELNEELVKRMNLDNLQDLLMILGNLSPVKSLGNKLHIGNIKEEEDLSFELDNGKELVEVHINDIKSVYSITIYKDNKAIHYLYNKKRNKVITEETFLQNDNLILKYHVNENEYFFELYNYENVSDTRIVFKANEFAVEDFIKMFFVEDDNLDEIIGLLPKMNLKIKQITSDYERDIIYQNNQLISDIKGEYDGEERKER